MFFGSTNSLVTFQTIMNKILQNLINTRKIANFIDDVIIGTEIEEKHDKIVERVIRRLVKNDLQKFLGLANYYCQFIKDFVVIARLLYDMVKKNQKWEQTDRQKKVFRNLKERFTKKLVLTAPDLDK